MKWKVIERADGEWVVTRHGQAMGRAQPGMEEALVLMCKLQAAEPKGRLPKVVRRCIEQALSKIDSKLRTGCGVPKEAQEAMRLYLDTWAAEPLKAVLEWDEGKGNARDLEIWSR